MADKYSQLAYSLFKVVAVELIRERLPDILAGPMDA